MPFNHTLKHYLKINESKIKILPIILKSKIFECFENIKHIQGTKIKQLVL
jgi:hypothetical protein